MDDITMLINKIDELKFDNDKDHKEIKDSIKLFPCLEHATKIARLEAVNGLVSNDKKNSKLDEVVTKRVMYIFAGVISGVILLLKTLPDIISALRTIGGQ